MFDSKDPLITAYNRLSPSSKQSSFQRAFNNLKKSGQSLLQKFSKKQDESEVPLGSSYTSKDKTPSFFQKAKSFFQKKPQEQSTQEAQPIETTQPTQSTQPTKSFSQRIKDKLSSTGKLLRQEYNRLTNKSNNGISYNSVSGGSRRKVRSRKILSRRRKH
jgi:hypothetical protein